MTNDEKAWREIVDNPNYEISNTGDVRHKEKKKILKQRISKWGYARARLSVSGISGGKLYAVHRLVANAFIPNPLNLPQVNHKDGNKLNNNVNNLEWVTAKDNTQHALRTGLLKSGNKSHRTIIHKNELIEVYGLRNLGLSYKQIGDIYNVDKSTISAIVRSKRYLKDYKKEEFITKVTEFVENNREKYKKEDLRGQNAGRSIIQKDKFGNIISEYKSVTMAAKANNVLHTSIVNNLKGRSKTCGGYIYEYKND